MLGADTIQALAGEQFDRPIEVPRMPFDTISVNTANAGIVPADQGPLGRFAFRFI